MTAVLLAVILLLLKNINGNGLSAAVWYYFASFVAGSNQSIV